MAVLTAALLAKAFIGFALSALVLHLGGFVLLGLRTAAWRFRRGRAQAAAGPGVTLLLPLGGSAPLPRQEASLRAAFAENYRRKEIIFCAFRQNNAGFAAIRAAREENAGQSSLLIGAPAGAAEAAKQGAEMTAAACLAKGFKAARYDYVATALPNAVLPADYIARLLSRRSKAKQSAALVCAALWAARERGLRQRLRAVFFNRRQIKLALADCFGGSIANASRDGGLSGTAALWDYEALHKAGGAGKLAAQAAARGADQALTELIRGQNGAIRYAVPPVPLDFSAASGQSAGGGQKGKSGAAAEIEWLRFYRRFLPRRFYAEPVLMPLLPFAACFAAWRLGGLGLGGLLGFIALWYAAELFFCACWGAAAGDKSAWKTYALLPARDAVLPFLWLAAARRR